MATGCAHRSSDAVEVVRWRMPLKRRGEWPAGAGFRPSRHAAAGSRLLGGYGAGGEPVFTHVTSSWKLDKVAAPLKSQCP